MTTTQPYSYDLDDVRRQVESAHAVLVAIGHRRDRPIRVWVDYTQPANGFGAHPIYVDTAPEGATLLIQLTPDGQWVTP